MGRQEESNTGSAKEYESPTLNVWGSVSELTGWGNYKERSGSGKHHKKPHHHWDWDWDWGWWDNWW